MSRLLAGPPRPGSTPEILEQVRAALQRRQFDFRLVVPTATLAEHLRHEMAREGLLVGGGLILTLSKFIEGWVRDVPEVSAAALDLLITGALERAGRSEFASVAQFPGFRASLARLIEEVSAIGCDARRLEEARVDAPLGPAFVAVLKEVEAELERRGWALRAQRLARAAAAIRTRGVPGVSRIFLDGFFTFSEPELDLIDALGRRAEVTVALPVWSGSEHARAALGPAEERRTPAEARVKRTLVIAATIEQEVEEIARRILEQAAAGRPFREMGIVLRSRDPYVPLLGTVLERFSIPARFYFRAPLAEHAVVRYLTGIVGALLGGWDHARTLEALRMAACGLGTKRAGDRFDFAVRERLPGQGLAGLRALSGDPLLEELAQLDGWRALRLEPRQWAARAASLRKLVRPPQISDRCTHHTALLWRTQAAALKAFEAAMEEAAGALPEEPLPLADFWETAEVVLQETPLGPPEQRRNVVHVLDVFEARQWELPVVFLCGLLEKQFPLYHGPDPVLPDAARAQLQAAGLRLSTTADKAREEEFLFELAATRATAELVLSYPESNAKGDPNLPSFFLDKLGLAAERARAVRPLCPPAPPRRAAVIRDEELLGRIRARHAAVSASGIEDFLQCPFRFFAGHTLELAEPPARPLDRLDPALKGSIVHQVLAEWQRAPQPLEPLLDRVFQDTCAERGVVMGCRAELARLSMLRDLRRFCEAPPLLEGWRVETEKDVRFALGDGTEVKGRIDRFDVSPHEEAAVFDFKYSGAESITRRIRGYEREQCVQGALYLSGLEEQYGYQPAGFFYYGLRGGLVMKGWHTGLPGFEHPSPPEELRARLAQAHALAERAASQIRAGRIEAAPADPEKCEYCPFRDACRVGEAVAVAVAAGGEAE